MDKKISEFPAASTFLSSTVIPVVISGVNQKTTLGELCENLTSLNNKGTQKASVSAPVGTTIPLTGALVSLPTSGAPYVLGAGSNGQFITLVSAGDSSVTVSTFNYTSVTLTAGSTIALVYSTSQSKWFVISSHNCTFA